jgi:hypothetical protein
MAEQKIYVGSGKEWGQYGNVGITVCVDDITPHVFEYNGKHYVKLNVSKKQQTDQYGKTHSVSVDTWKPEQKEETKKWTPKPQTQAQIDEMKNKVTVEYPEEDLGDLPF